MRRGPRRRTCLWTLIIHHQANAFLDAGGGWVSSFCLADMRVHLYLENMVDSTSPDEVTTDALKLTSLLLIAMLQITAVEARTFVSGTIVSSFRSFPPFELTHPGKAVGHAIESINPRNHLEGARGSQLSLNVTRES